MCCLGVQVVLECMRVCFCMRGCVFARLYICEGAFMRVRLCRVPLVYMCVCECIICVQERVVHAHTIFIFLLIGLGSIWCCD